MGDTVELPAGTPSDLIPKPLILYSPTTEKILYARLGKSKVEDIRYLQQRLVKIVKDLKSPRQARLDRNDTDLVAIDTIECPQGKGELGLTTRLGSTINLSLMLEGGITENTKVKASTIFQVDAIISTAKLSPNSDWSGFIRDSCFKELIDILKDKAALIEQNLLVDEKAPIEMRLRLLEAYPLPDSVIKELPIFATAKIGQFTTLAQIEKEWQKHGVLIQSKLSIGLEDRLILQPPEKQLMPLLEKQLGNIKWVQESEVIKTESSRKSFYLKPALSEIKLGLVKCLLRTKFNEGEGDTCGEIGIVDLDHEIDSGYVDCYVDHRHICRDHNLISRPFVAAIASPYLKPNEYFTSVETAAEVKRQLEKHRSALMLAAANSGKKRLNDIAWSYFSSKSSKSEERKKFIETQSLQIVDGSTKTVKELQDIKIRGYATIRFSWYNTNDGVVLLLEPEKVKQVSAILEKRLSDLSDTLENELKQHEYLLQLPTKIDQALKPKLFSASKISAEIAFAPDRFGPDISGFIVGLNSNGQTIGQLPPPLYPIVAVVKGIKSSKKKQANAIHQAVIQGQERTILNSWIEEVCLDWIEHLANPRLSKHQEILLDLLLKTMRNIGSTGSVPAAMAEKLWNLPLFERVDGTRVSGLALDAAIISSKKPIVLAEIRAASPGSAILMKEKSRAYKILASRFGDDCLQWADRPMLLDPKKMAKSIWKFINSDIHLPNIYFSFIDDSFKYLADYLNKEVKLFAKPKAASNPSNTSPQVRMIDDLQSDIKNVIGRNLFSKADGLFLELGFGRWPLGPAMYPKGKNGSFRLNLLHSGIRWLASNDKDDRQGRVALTLLAILWVAMVNDRSKQFTDEHEGLFLERLGERLIDIYGAEAKKS